MEACTCVALEGAYCSEFCERTAGQELVTCDCGHKDCAGAPEMESAVG